MYYRNFSGDLNAMNARGVQNDIALSPRDGEGAETTSEVRALRGAGGSRDDLSLPLGQHLSPSKHVVSLSAPVTARDEENESSESENKHEVGGHGEKEEDVSFMSERARADRDIALTLQALRTKMGVALANSNYIHDAVTHKKEGVGERGETVTECSWMIPSRKKTPSATQTLVDSQPE